MKIKIGDKNKIKNSNIGSKVSENIKKKSPVKTIIIGICIAVIAGIILLFIEYCFDILGVFS